MSLTCLSYYKLNTSSFDEVRYQLSIFRFTQPCSELNHSVTQRIMLRLIVTHIILWSLSKKGQRPSASLSTISQWENFRTSKLLMIKDGKVFMWQKYSILQAKAQKSKKAHSFCVLQFPFDNSYRTFAINIWQWYNSATLLFIFRIWDYKQLIFSDALISNVPLNDIV